MGGSFTSLNLYFVEDFLGLVTLVDFFLILLAFLAFKIRDEEWLCPMILSLSLAMSDLSSTPVLYDCVGFDVSLLYDVLLYPGDVLASGLYIDDPPSDGFLSPLYYY